MSCNRRCNSLCPNLVISTSVAVVTVNGVDTLLINIPEATYKNNSKYCIIVAQAIPSTATINMPVAISIGGDTATVYPLTNRCCAQITACAIRTRTRYPVCVSTSATGGTFKVLSGLCCAPNNALASLPAPTTGATPAAASLETAGFAVKTTSAKPKKSDTVTEVK